MNDGEQFIGTVDLQILRRLRWPVLRLLAPRYVEGRELCRYERDLLATGLWSMIRVQREQDSHVCAIYGVPRDQRTPAI